MDDERDRKRKKDKHRDDDEERKEKRSKRPRSRSRSPTRRDERDSRRKRRYSRSKSPEAPKVEKDSSEVKKEVPVRRNKETDMLNTRTGGAYIPPARLRMMQAQITDKASVAYQRLAWEALKKSIHGHINKINVGNIGIIIKELLRENIVRGRGLLCRSVIQAQAASPTFTNVYAALVAAVNSRFPNIGELLLKRLVIQFKRGFKRNDKPICISSASFIAHLVNQRVAHEILALELLTLLVETPTDDSVEVAIAFLKECGQKLTEVSSKGVNAIFEMLRNILHEGQLDKRVQYMIEVMFQIWKDGFKDHPALIEELELVPEEDQFTHLLMLDDATDSQDILNVFKFDDKYEENEQKYKDLSKEILGSDAESGEEGSGSESGSEEDDEDEETEAKPVTIIDNTETNLIALRRTIYLTINSSLDFEECAHKLMKMQLKPGQEVELCHMFLDCCAEQRTYEKFYGLLAQRFCNINRIYIGPFEEIFKDSYGTAHRLDTNRLRNVSKFFAHLLFTDSISWEVLECVKLNEEDTTSSSRIYIKILFQELAEYMGLKKLNDRLKDPTLQGAFSSVFPRDNPKNTRFSINFFTSIGLGGLTDELREHLKQMPKNVPPAITEIKVDSESSSDSSSSSSSSDSSSSDSDSDEEDNAKSKKSKSKDKDKSKKKKEDSIKPRTPAGDNNTNILKEAKERWGHDGFFDTYGKDAQRHERKKDDDDNFAKPYPKDRNDRRRDDRNSDNRRGEDRNDDRRGDVRNDYRRGDDIRGDERRRDDRRGDNRRGDVRNDDDRRGDNRRNDDRNGDDRRRDDRPRYDNREDDRSLRGRKENAEDRRNNGEDSRDRSRDDRGKRSEDDGYESRSRSDRERNEKRDDTDRRNDRDGRNERLDDREKRRNDMKDKNDTEDKYDRADDRDSRRNERDSRKEKDDRDVRKNRDERNEKESQKHDDDGYESRSKRKDKERSVDKRRKDSSDEKGSESESDTERERERSKKKQLKDKKRMDASEKKDIDSDTDHKREKERSKKDKRKEKKRNDSTDEKDCDSESDTEREREKTKKSKKEKKRKDVSEEESESETDQKKKDKRSKKEKRKERNSDTEESDSDTEKRKKNKKSKKKSKKNEQEWDIKTKDDLEDTKSIKRRKTKPTSPEWDIHRASSVKRDVSGRYWDSQKTRHTEDRDISPKVSDRKRQG